MELVNRVLTYLYRYSPPTWSDRDWFVSHMGSHITGLICTALHLILEFLMMAGWWSFRPKHIVVFSKRKNVVVFDVDLTIWFQFKNTTGCPI